MTDAQTPRKVDVDLVTYEEACRIAGIGKNALKAAIGRGRLHPIKVLGSATKYLHRGEIEAYRDKRPWTPPEDTAHNASAVQTLDTATIAEISAQVGIPFVQLGDTIARQMSAAISTALLARTGQGLSAAGAGVQAGAPFPK